MAKTENVELTVLCLIQEKILKIVGFYQKECQIPDNILNN